MVMSEEATKWLFYFCTLAPLCAVILQALVRDAVHGDRENSDANK